MKSKRFQLTRRDLKSWGVTAVIFIIPVALIYFAFVQENIVKDGFAWSDFIPNTFVQGAMVSYVLAEITALLKKFLSEVKS